MATVGEILGALRQGVDDETWEAYARELTAQGADLLPYGGEEGGSHRYQLRFGPHDSYYVQRGASGLWRMA
jgi:hypothetical protein